MSSFKPMLAATATEDHLKALLRETYLIASPKLDGIRCLIHNGVALSRSLKPIPNRYVQECLANCPNGLDGELIVGEPTAFDVYRKTNSAVMSVEGTPNFRFYVFDDFERAGTYEDSIEDLYRAARHWGNRLVYHESQTFDSTVDLRCYERECLDLGYEGLILRRPDSPYKFGRSTLKESFLLKLKRFTDAEAVIIGVEELLHNGNEATTNELGYTHRSSHKVNKTGSGLMGALICRDLESGVEFKIGTGFTMEDRAKEWAVGATVKYKSFKIGVKDAPRHPVFLGLRDPMDL